MIVDRCQQARVRSALEPEREARFEPRSYGFRPGRGCQDAIQAIYTVAKGKRAKRLWALDADPASAFDLIAHGHILNQLGSFPARENDPRMTEGWRGRARSTASHRGRRSPGRCSQPAALEHRPARDRARRRSPLPPDRHHRRKDDEGLARADQIRRRPPLPLPHQAAGARGQSPARRPAGAHGAGVQQGQDARRLPRGGPGLPGVQRPPLPRQTADQTQQGGAQTDPGTTPRRAALPAREQRRRGDQTTQPDHPGDRPTTTGHTQRPRSSTSSTNTRGGSPTSGPGSVTRTSRRPG